MSCFLPKVGRGRRKSSTLIISALWRDAVFSRGGERRGVWFGGGNSRTPGVRLVLRLVSGQRGSKDKAVFVRQRRKPRGWKCVRFCSAPLLLYRMCHNPRQAPSRAGTVDNMSCLLPVPPPCSASPPSLPFSRPPPPSPPLPSPKLSVAHTYGHTATQVHSHTCTHTSPHGSLTGLRMDFFYLMWFGL